VYLQGSADDGDADMRTATLDYSPM